MNQPSQTRKLLISAIATATNASIDTIAAIDSRRVRVGRRMGSDVTPAGVALV